MASSIDKFKKSQTPKEKVYKFFTLDEMNAKEITYINRVMDLKKCLNFVQDALLEMGHFNVKQLLQDKWEDFLSCNPLPKPYIPPDIHLFYNKLKYWEKENVDMSMSWLLSVNERSILSQDPFGKDLTSRKMHASLKVDIGHEYNSYIRDSIILLQRINNFLDNAGEISKCPSRILDDIVKHKLAIQQEIIDFIDRFTYRIISSENAEMKSIDATTAEYLFNASDFKIHIWCLKNVAIRFCYLSEPSILANFSSMNLQLHIPAEMLKENLVVRGVHMKYDHLTEMAKSFKSPFPSSRENLNENDLDLHKCLQNEWSMQVEMQNKKISEIKEKYLEYQALKQHYEEQLEKQKQQSKSDQNTKRKLPKMPREPVTVADNMVPDVYDDFLEDEQKRYETFMKNVLSPELLNLPTDEINLRKYDILGGIYQLYYVQKPLHIDFNSFNMTWHKNETKLVIERNIQIKTDLGRNNQSLRRTTKRFSVFDLNRGVSEPDRDSPWFIVTLELPEYLCYWSEPIACQFIESLEKKDHSQSSAASTFKPHVRESKPISQLNSQTNFQKLNTSDEKKLRSPLISRTSLKSSSLKAKRKSIATSTTSIKSLHINDFSLVNILTKPQIRQIEKYILPRIISSYKFPKEVQHEDSLLLQSKSKGKGGRILRQKTDDVPQKFSQRQFTFNDRQNNPERMYAKYPRVDNIHILSHLKELDLLDDKDEPVTFAQLLQIIDVIKEKYKSNKNHLLDLEPLRHKIVTQNKRIKQMLRQKKRNTSKFVSTIASQNKEHSAIAPVETAETKITETESLIEEELRDGMDNNFFVGTESSSILDYEQNSDKSEIVNYLKWTTEYILKSRFDRKNHKIVIQTDRLGNFGFAFRRYEHFPFKYWTMEPNANDPENEVVFTLDTQHVRCVLYITANGIRGHVTDPTKAFVRNPKMYLIIEEPIKDLKELKYIFKEKYLNIFAEQDAAFYIENGYFSEKHLPNELHTYNCMAVHSTQMCFNFSLWNRLAARRDIILKFKQYQDIEDNLVEARITPGTASFVEIQELCSDDLDAIKLEYNLTWRNIEMASYYKLYFQKLLQQQN